MRSGGARAFWLSLALTLAVLLPLIGVVALWSQWQREAAPADEGQSGVPIHRPGAEHSFNWLVAVAGEHPAFVLLRLDARQGRLRVAALPGETVLTQGGQPVQLAESYRQAGPARAAQLVAETLGVPVDRYLAISRQSLAAAFGPVGRLRVNLTGLLTQAERQAAGFADPVQEFTAGAGAEFLAEQELPPPRLAVLRSGLWEAYLRQNLEDLPGAAPDALRRVSSTLLTDVSALDLYTLAETLEFLADSHTEAESAALPGHWNSGSGRFELTPDAVDWAARVFGGQAAGPSALDPWPEELSSVPEPEQGPTASEAPASPSPVPLAPAGGLAGTAG